MQSRQALAATTRRPRATCYRCLSFQLSALSSQLTSQRELIVRRGGEPAFAEYLRKGIGSLALEQEAQQCRWPGPFLTPEAQATLEAKNQQQPEGGVTI